MEEAGVHDVGGGAREEEEAGASFLAHGQEEAVARGDREEESGVSFLAHGREEEVSFLAPCGWE